MWKNLSVGILGVTMVGALVVGAVKLASLGTDVGSAERLGRGAAAVQPLGACPGTEGAGRQAHGGMGRSAGVVVGSHGPGAGGRASAAAEALPVRSSTVTGTVAELPDLVIDCDGRRISVGLGPVAYRQQAGFELALGDEVRAVVFEAYGERKALRIENLSTGTSLVLRDEAGRAMWSGGYAGKAAAGGGSS